MGPIGLLEVANYRRFMGIFPVGRAPRKEIAQPRGLPLKELLGSGQLTLCLRVYLSFKQLGPYRSAVLARRSGEVFFKQRGKVR